jgi:6-phosphogluconate dehydrogenase (decarboxylating)
MELGMIGLGRMGTNMVRRLLRAKRCITFVMVQPLSQSSCLHIADILNVQKRQSVHRFPVNP